MNVSHMTALELVNELKTRLDLNGAAKLVCDMPPIGRVTFDLRLVEINGTPFPPAEETH